MNLFENTLAKYRAIDINLDGFGKYDAYKDFYINDKDFYINDKDFYINDKDFYINDKDFYINESVEIFV